MRTPLYFLLAICLLPVTVWAEGFAKIRAIDGVRDVIYEAPFLFVISRSLADNPRIRIAVQELEKEGSEPDLVRLGGLYNLRYYNEESYELHKRDQSLAKRANSVFEMQELLKRARFTTVVELDWASEEVATSRKRFYGKLLPPGADAVRNHDLTIDEMVAKLGKMDRHPDKLICMEFFSVGRIVYPVFDGKIHANGKLVSYQAFSKAFGRVFRNS